MQWPQNNQPLEFEQLVDPVVEAIRFAYDLKRKNETSDIPWTGPGSGKNDRSCVPDGSKMLSVSSLEYAEERDRDALTEIISVAMRVGIEQGRRMTLTSTEITSLEFRARMGDRYIDILDKKTPS